MSQLWQKGNAQPHPVVCSFTVGDDTWVDKELLPFDIRASIAHVRSLARIGVLDLAESDLLVMALSELNALAVKGEVIIRVEDEDCHTVIENFLVQKLGDIGKKVHTGRSRNDQVLTALRLMVKERLQGVIGGVKKLAHIFLSGAEKYQSIPMPGYSHTQQAMLSSVGHWFLSFVDLFLDDADVLKAVLARVDRSPLGSAAGFGVSFALDREGVAKELGFSSVQVNSLACQSGRGKWESVVLEGLSQVMMTSSRFSNDVLLFTSREFGFFTVLDSLITGSSIMPQKRNLDGLEMVRGRSAELVGYQVMVKEVAKGLISGYHRDYQLLKKPLLEGLKIVESSLMVVGLYAEGIRPNEEVIKRKICDDIFMADEANRLVKEEGMSFREAYLRVGMDRSNGENSIFENLKSKVSLGGPGNLGLEEYHARVDSI